MIGPPRAALPALIGLSIFLAHCRGNMGCADSMWSIPTAVSLVDRGDADLDEFQVQLAARHHLFTERHGGHEYTMFPLGTSMLAAPAIPLLRAIASVAFGAVPSWKPALEKAQYERGCPPLAGEPVIALHSWTEMTIASAIVAIAAVVVFTIARAELAPMSAALVALIFAFGTSAWSTASRSLWQHGPSMLILSLALLVQLRDRAPAAAGLLLAFAYVVRPTDAIVLAVVSAWVLWRRRQTALAFFAGVLAVLVPFVVANQAMYGRWLPPYYAAGRIGTSPLFWEALAGHIVSPSRGLLVFSPVLAFAAHGVLLKIRQQRFTALDGSLVLVLILHWLAISSFPHWWGGHSYGPRFFSDMLPYLVYFLVPTVAWLRTLTGARREVAAWTFAVASVASVAIHAAGALSPGAMRWNDAPVPIDEQPARVWDWHDPQFLAGFRRPR